MKSLSIDGDRGTPGTFQMRWGRIIPLLFIVILSGNLFAASAAHNIINSDYESSRIYINDLSDANDADIGNGMTPLIAVVAHKSFTNKQKQHLIDILLGKGADIDGIDYKGNTALMFAVSRNSELLVQFLINKGADTDMANMGGTTPYILAVKRGNKKIASLLSLQGAALDTKNNKGETLLFTAVMQGNRNRTDELIKQGHPIDPPGKTPLMAACLTGNIDLAKYLVEKHGANVNAMAHDGNTPISLAAQYGKLSLIKYLVKQGSTIDYEGITPLMNAAAFHDKKLVEYLMGLGANINSQYKEAYSPVYMAMLNSNYEIAAYLISQGATLPQVDLTKRPYIGGILLRIYARHHARQQLKKMASRDLQKAVQYFEISANEWQNQADNAEADAASEERTGNVLAGLQVLSMALSARQMGRNQAKTVYLPSYGKVPTPNFQTMPIPMRSDLQRDLFWDILRRTDSYKLKASEYKKLAEKSRTLALSTDALLECYKKSTNTQSANQCFIDMKEDYTITP